ncbi:MAG: RNA polymerase sigma factor [Opitutaceae bacterium]
MRDVDDVVQESYLRVWRARAAQPIESARAFLFRVARNIALDLVRRDRRAPLEQVGDLAELDVVDESESSDVRHGVVTRERIALITEALDALPSRQRQLVILCKLQGLSHRTAAEQLGLAEKTVTEHVYRGVQRLGEELQRRGLYHFHG